MILYVPAEVSLFFSPLVPFNQSCIDLDTLTVTALFFSKALKYIMKLPYGLNLTLGGHLA